MFTAKAPGEGTSARWAAERARQAAEQAKAEAEFTRYTAKYPEKAAEIERKRQAKEERQYKKILDNRLRGNESAYFKGREDGKNISLEQQAEGPKNAPKLTHSSKDELV